MIVTATKRGVNKVHNIYGDVICKKLYVFHKRKPGEIYVEYTQIPDVFCTMWFLQILLHNILAYFKVLSQQLPERTQENNIKFSSHGNQFTSQNNEEDSV